MLVPVVLLPFPPLLGDTCSWRCCVWHLSLEASPGESALGCCEEEGEGGEGEGKERRVRRGRGRNGEGGEGGEKEGKWRRENEEKEKEERRKRGGEEREGGKEEEGEREEGRRRREFSCTVLSPMYLHYRMSVNLQSGWLSCNYHACYVACNACLLPKECKQRSHANKHKTPPKIWQTLHRTWVNKQFTSTTNNRSEEVGQL